MLGLCTYHRDYLHGFEFWAKIGKGKYSISKIKGWNWVAPSATDSKSFCGCRKLGLMGIY